MKRRKYWLIALAALIACVGIGAAQLHRWQPKLPERAADGAAWNEGWVTLGSVLGVEEPGNGLALVDNNSILTADDTYLASWASAQTVPYANEDGEADELPEAQLYLLAQGCKDAANAAIALDEWIARERDTYDVLETRAEVHNDQEYTILIYEVASDENPYARGATAFATRQNYALTAELTCVDGYAGDAAAMLGAFLDGFHYNAAI